MTFFLSTALAVFIMFVVPGLAAWFIISPWNQRRLARARRYRAAHGTPWWVASTSEPSRSAWDA